MSISCGSLSNHWWHIENISTLDKAILLLDISSFKYKSDQWVNFFFFQRLRCYMIMKNHHALYIQCSVATTTKMSSIEDMECQLTYKLILNMNSQQNVAKSNQMDFIDCNCFSWSICPTSLPLDNIATNSLFCSSNSIHLWARLSQRRSIFSSFASMCTMVFWRSLR